MSTSTYYYQRQINSLADQKEELNNLITSLSNSLITALEIPSESLKKANDGIVNNYILNDEQADKKSIIGYKDEIDSIIKKINGTVIPSIIEKISSINSSISYFQRLIREIEDREREEEKK